MLITFALHNKKFQDRKGYRNLNKNDYIFEKTILKRGFSVCIIKDQFHTTACRDGYH
jgi:hypothetical protein